MNSKTSNIHNYQQTDSEDMTQSNIKPSRDYKLLLQMINSISDSVNITDMENEILFANNAFLKMYGYQLEEIIGKKIELLRSDKNDPKQISKIHPATMNGGWHGRLLNRKKDGTEFTIELSTSLIKDENGVVVALVGISRDMTSQIKVEEKLREAQDKYRTLFLELKDAVYESSVDGKFIELNPAGLELFSVKTFDDLKHIDIAKEIYLRQDERDQFKKELERTGFVSNYQIDIKRLNGEIATVLETSMAVKNRKGEIIGYRGILRDITEIKKNEERLRLLVEKFENLNIQLKKSEQELKELNAAKDRFFSIVAHDLRSPFSSLLSFSEFLVEDIDELPKEEIKSFAEKINESSKTVFSLLENLLQWSRIQTGKIPYEPITFNIYHKINQIINLLKNNAESKKINVVNDVTSSAIVFADEDMIFSVIQNLLSNAIKFTKESGSIIFRSNSKENDVEISITDNGVGIKEVDMRKLFRMDSHHTTYGTKDEKGSGLGLLLCREMVERNRGKIWVTSKVGEGTTFTFTVPKG
ncbi:MAG: PAS domain-containing sensor histidine kinase [Melioribacteraceae bacterium]|nr:PAS domain-containing sensor histidine kinase [Melioribacteraceae bacterium]